MSETTPLKIKSPEDSAVSPGAGSGVRAHRHHHEEEGDEMERPFTVAEKVKKVILVIIGYPISLSILLLPGAWLRTYPEYPPLWVGYWMIQITVPILGLVTIIVLMNRNPRIVRERLGRVIASKNESPAEQLFHKITIAIFLLGLLGMTYDAVGKRDVYPIVWNWIGIICLVFSYAWIVYVFQANKYASRVFHRQQGQQLIQTGPYGVVRHPMYMGMIPCFMGFSLAAGSFWGLVPMGLIGILMGYRTYDEEEFLVQTFGSEYEEYRRKVRYRMIPGVF